MPSSRSNPFPETRATGRWALARRFAIAGASIGLFVGLLEAALLFFIPRAGGLLHPDVRYVIWLIAPLVDLLSAALLGLILGILGSARRAFTKAVLAGIGLGVVGAYVLWMLAWFRVIFLRRLGMTTPIFCFVIIFVAAILLFKLFRGRVDSFFVPDNRTGLTRWLVANAVAIIVLSAGILVYAFHRQPRPQVTETPARSGLAPGRPNLVLIVLDTVRADHLSCYGYHRPTTPHLDRLASHGVLFQNVVASSSWTLPSLASIFTGLLPHQHGANWGSALAAGPWTLAKILESKGYETVGFNANPYYGLGGWRLDEGFNVYEDDSYALRHNLDATFVGQSALRYLYNRLIRYNQFNHRDAADVNQDAIGWWQHRDQRHPFFLFINYMDAHRPYLPPSPWDHRFGCIPHGLLARLEAPLREGFPSKPYTARERQDLVDGYDNSLAYLDDQVGRLVRFLTAQPGGNDTIFIVTSDHGEGFGEHGTYDHGWNLYSEVLRVPLIIWGPGVPQGVRVKDLVPSRKLFSTVLDLTLGLKGPIAQTSLDRYWKPGFEPRESEVVSELSVFGPASDPASLSLTTPEWHLIWSTGGKVELYDSRQDPKERASLVASPDLRDTLQNLQNSLEARLAYSVLPWHSLAYLSPLDQPGATFVQQVSGAHLRLTPAGIPVGAVQALFSHEPPSQLLKPTPAEQDLLQSLPYH